MDLGNAAPDQAGSQALGGTPDSAGTQNPVGSQGTPEQAAPAISGGATFPLTIGNQVFKTPDELRDSYSGLQKTFTQKTQDHAREAGLYKSLASWLGNLKRDPVAWDRFKEYMRGGASPQQAAQATKADAASGNLEQSQGRPQASADDGRWDDLHERLDKTENRVDYSDFVRRHPDLSSEEVSEILMRTAELAEEGKRRSLEEVYRVEFFDKAAAKFYEKGSKDLEASRKKSQEATSLGSVPPTAAPDRQGKRYGELHTEGDRDQHIANLFKKRGVSFDR